MLDKPGRKGLILAAGYGSRLKGSNPVTDFKPLTPIAGKPIILRTIDSLQKAGCTGIVIVLGHGHDEIKSAIANSYRGEISLEFVYNERFDLSNGVSVLSAKEYVGSEFVMTMADHILGDSVMETAKNYHPAPDSSALLVDYKIETIFDMDDATKVLTNGDQIVSIGKQISEYNCIDTGVFVCTKALLDSLQEHYQKFGDTSISDGVQDLARTGKMVTVDIKDGFWQDVDTPEMLEHVEKYFSDNQS